MDTKNLVEKFAVLLDENKFSEAKRLLSEVCSYELLNSNFFGPDEIIASYSQNYEAGKTKFDEIRFTSKVSQKSENDFVIEYTDELRKGNRWHQYRCNQEIVIRGNKIIGIKHVEIPGEKEKLEQFKNS
jgi:hypothetical protein